MNTVGFISADQDEVFSIIAGVLHIGNTEFKEDGSFAKLSSNATIKHAARVSNPQIFGYQFMYKCKLCQLYVWILLCISRMSFQG